MRNHPQAKRNYEGGLGYSASPEMDLYLRTTTFLAGEPKTYETADEAFQGLINSTYNVLETNPEFVLQLAVYTRNKLHLRSVPLVLVTEFANSQAVGTVPGARSYTDQVIQRADEITELVALNLQRQKMLRNRKGAENQERIGNLPEMIKRGVAMSFNKFDEYQFGKWGRK